MEHAGETYRLAGVDAERHDVLDLEVDRVADTHTVNEPVVLDVDRSALHAEHLADERSQGAHGAAELSTEHEDELVELRFARLVVDEDADAPIALRHDLRRVRDNRNLAAADVRAVDVACSDVEDQRHPAVVVGRSV